MRHSFLAKVLILIISGIFSAGAIGHTYAQNIDALRKLNGRLSAKIKQYDPAKFNYCISTSTIDLQTQKTILKTDSAVWEINLAVSNSACINDPQEVVITYVCKSGVSRNANLSACLTFNKWSASNYVLFPGAVYNGNRFDWRRITYSPKLMDPKDIGPNFPTIISDVPKLNINNGPSFVQERSGSMAIPAAGFFAPAEKSGFLVLTDQGNNYGDYGMGIEETKGKTSGEISISSPLVRELYKYRITDLRYPSNDVPATFKAGDSLKIHLKLYSFDAPVLQTVFDKVSDIRQSMASKGSLSNTLSFSDAFRTIKDKYNDANYVDKYGYYSVGLRENFLQDWQIGWTGGMISTYPLLNDGDADTKKRVIRNFDWLFPNGISPSGFFYDSGEQGTKWYGGDIRKLNTKNWHLVRKSGDGVYYIIKQFILMNHLGIPVKDSWKTGTQGVADTFVKLWKENGQLGQFIDSQTGKIAVGGSTSGAIVPGALCLAYRFYGNEQYLKTATEIGEYYHENFVKKGLTTGGPGDALQNPDSESCYALIESFTTLYETTQDKRWLLYAQNTTKQFASWVMGYDYSFPPNSLFGKLGIQSKGAVFANTQNKHGAPAICTFSGQALLKLYRFTGDTFYKDLLNDIVHNMPQYLGHPLKPIPGMKAGWMSERVNTTDWLEEVGEIAYITTWAETSMMLVYSEIPGLYVQPDKGIIVPFDNVSAVVTKNSPGSIRVRVSNPTKTTATIKVLQENQSELKNSLEESMRNKIQVVSLKPNESRVLTFSKTKK
ncbi:MAG: hypothetical protein H7Y07_09530 [Pyrinomonadaceae bacterium]|nr:hypothetical protein [Sphingobacteriaceae bacterium]